MANEGKTITVALIGSDLSGRIFLEQTIKENDWGHGLIVVDNEKKFIEQVNGRKLSHIVLDVNFIVRLDPSTNFLDILGEKIIEIPLKNRKYLYSSKISLKKKWENQKREVLKRLRVRKII